MSFIFGGKAPKPAPLPVSPMVDNSAIEERNRAETAAVAESMARGRRSTIAAGGLIAEADQADRIQRRASKVLG